MRFFWKIFFTTMFLAVSCTALTGYALIRSNVTALLEADAVRTVEAGSVAAYALAAATGGQEEQVRESVSFMDISYGGEPLRFLVLDETGELVFSSLDSAHQQPLASLQDAENQVWHLAAFLWRPCGRCGWGNRCFISVLPEAWIPFFPPSCASTGSCSGSWAGRWPSEAP